MSDYACLYDRVQMGLDKPQDWGTQAKCETGNPVLYPVDDLDGLDARRKELFMPPIREYLQIDYLVKFCAQQGK